jgi:hypothetical protein
VLAVVAALLARQPLVIRGPPPHAVRTFGDG